MTTSEKCELALPPANAMSAADSNVAHRHSTRCVERSCCFGSTGGAVGWEQTQCRVTAGVPQHDSAVPQQPPQRSASGEFTRAVHGPAQPNNGAAPTPMISASVSMVLVREGCMGSSSSRNLAVLEYYSLSHLSTRRQARQVRPMPIRLIKRSVRTNGSVRHQAEDAGADVQDCTLRAESPREADQHVKRDSSMQRSRAVLHPRRSIAATRDEGWIAVTIAIAEGDDNVTTSWRSWRLFS